ncbi:putative signal transducing protein [Celerinatantimonas yamalensis]|uniref:DUF2007 domain-containing protein n=1 Tax=Celerinatantimonas yamalensis TaxID=559956 RepID=A0ABW9GC81_9GAMM
MVEVGCYNFAHEAYIAKASLAASGIDSVIVDEHLVGMMHTLGAVRLWVDESDLQSATEVLQTDFSDDKVN